MKIINDILECNEDIKNSYVAIGTFDGVHFGHRKIIKNMVKRARENNGVAIVFTFANHPMEIINIDKTPKSINTIEEKLQLFEDLGVDYVVLQKFDHIFANILEDEFVELLKRKLDSRELFVGFNFSFGKGGKGKPSDLKKLGLEREIIVNEIAPVTIDGHIISSTFIRQILPDGDIEDINKYLGHYFLIKGEVVHGRKLARELGFPTANIKLARRIYPKNGIYGVRVKIEGEKFSRYGVVNIGVNPTLKQGEKTVEVNILDFDEMIYGKIISIELIKYLREEKKFSSIDELKRVIGNDVDTWTKMIKKSDFDGDSIKN